MADEKRTFFRPSLAIFVGEVGEDVRAQLSPNKLLAHLDPQLRQGVGLIQYPVDDDKARSWLVRDMFPDTQQSNVSTQLDTDLPPNEEGPLQQVVWNTLNNVQSENRLLNFSLAGYTVVDTDTQIYIVGDVTSPYMRDVMQQVRALLARNTLNTEVCYVLSRYQPGSPGPVDWTKRDDWDKRDIANFCFIYENKLYPFIGFVTEEQSYYAAAEALFALMATGITTQDDYKQMMALLPNFTSYSQVGNLSSSLVFFPRAEVQRFCSAYLGAELMDDWIEDIYKSKTLDSERARQQQRARDAVEDIKNWIQDSQTRPGTEWLTNQPKSRQSEDNKSRLATRVNKWPTLNILLRGGSASSKQERQKGVSIPSVDGSREESLLPQDRLLQEERTRQEERLRQEERRMHASLRDQTETLFKFFSFKSVKKVSKEYRQAPETWAKIAYDRSGSASDMLENWNRLATTAWGAASNKTTVDIQRTLDRIWPASNNGFDLARIYVDEYDDQLAELVNLLSIWREVRQKDYQDALSYFDQLSRGEWEQGQTIIGGLNQNSGGVAGPTGANINARANAGGQAAQAGAGIAGRPQPQAGLHQHLSPREDELARRLGQRVTWEQNRVSKRVNLVGGAALAAPALALTALALLPVLAANPLTMLAVFIAVIGLLVAGNLVFHRLQQRDVETVQKDLLKFYCRYYAHRCEVREDHLRRHVLIPLCIRVQRMRERLDDIDGFLTQVSNGLESLAHEAHDDLLTERNPAAIRDVFIADGARLQETKRPTRNLPMTPKDIRLQRIARHPRAVARANTPTQSLFAGSGRKPTNTLEDVAAQIYVRRLNAPKEIWHSPIELRSALLRSFQNHSESLLEMTLEQTQHHICEFTQRVIQVYLVGDLVDISRALDSEETWDYVFERMERPVYHPQVGNPTPELVLICGRQVDIAKRLKYIQKKQRDFTVVSTYNQDWLLVAGCFRDSSPAALDVEILFPL